MLYKSIEILTRMHFSNVVLAVYFFLNACNHAFSSAAGLLFEYKDSGVFALRSALQTYLRRDIFA